MKPTILLFFKLCIASLLPAQNLIPNAGFEHHSDCPQKFWTAGESWLIENWFPVNYSTPDYFNRCSTGNSGSPENWAGEVIPFEGLGFAGMYVWGTREFMGVRLEERLKVGHTYTFSAYVQLSSKSHYISGNIGFAFVDTVKNTLGTNNVDHIKPTCALNKNDPFAGEPMEWELVTCDFVANGLENYLIIGNFSSNENTVAIELPINSKNGLLMENKSYFYIDNLLLEDANPTTRTPE